MSTRRNDFVAGIYIGSLVAAGGFALTLSLRESITNVHDQNSVRLYGLLDGLDQSFVRLNETSVSVDEHYVRLDRSSVRLDQRFVRLDESSVGLDLPLVGLVPSSGETIKPCFYPNF